METKLQKKRNKLNLQVQAPQTVKEDQECQRIPLIVNQDSNNNVNEVLSPLNPNHWEEQTPLFKPKENLLPICPKKERKEKMKEVKQKAEKIDFESCIRILTYGITSETNSPTKRKTHDIEICNIIVPCLYCPLQKHESPDVMKHAITSERLTEQLMILKAESNYISQDQKLQRANSFEDEENSNDWFKEEGFNKVKRRGKRLLSITEKGKILKYGFGETAHEQDPATSFGGMKVALSVPKKH